MNAKQIIPHLMVKNVQETLDFYTKKLLFEPVYSQNDSSGRIFFSTLKLDNTEVMIADEKSHIKKFPVLKGKEIGFSGIIYFEVENIEDYYEKIKSNTEIYLKLTATWYQTTEFHIIDNNGYILGFFQSL